MDCSSRSSTPPRTSSGAETWLAVLPDGAAFTGPTAVHLVGWWESILRMFVRCLDIPVEIQPPLKDKEGRELRRGDLRVRGTNLLIEYDGADHRSREGHRYDLRRERALLEHIRGVRSGAD